MVGRWRFWLDLGRRVERGYLCCSILSLAIALDVVVRVVAVSS
jgi:hypothetical protein